MFCMVVTVADGFDVGATCIALLWLVFSIEFKKSTSSLSSLVSSRGNNDKLWFLSSLST